MSKATRALLVLLSLFFGGWSVSALTGNSMIHSSWSTLGVSSTLATVIASLELAAALGLLLGQKWPGLALAASLGLVGMMSGAAVFHLRAEDGFAIHGSLVLLTASVFAVAGTFPEAARRARLSWEASTDTSTGRRAVVLAWDAKRPAAQPALVPVPLSPAA